MTGKSGLVLFLLLASACTAGDVTGPTPTNPPPSATPTSPPTITTRATVTCSASNIESDGETASDVPAAVAEMRLAIREAAIACDYQRLADLALAGRDEFTYSFGGGDDPAEHWQDAENRGEEVMAILVKILEMSGAQKEAQFEADVFTTIYAWPAASSDNPSDSDWEEVGELYTDEEIASMKELGGYIGYRIGMTPDGDWVYYVAGD